MIRHLQKTLPLTLRFHHVKGHQDCRQITVLSREASMNVEMDEEGKWKVSTDLPINQQYHIPYEGSICFIEGKCITKNLTDNLQKHINGLIILNHRATTQRFTNGAEKLINWDMAANAMKALPKARQQWVSKLVSKFLLYRKSMQRWKLRNQAKSPQYSCPIKDKDHVIWCLVDLAKVK